MWLLAYYEFMAKNLEEAERLAYAQSKLRDSLLRLMPEEGVYPTAIAGVGMARRNHADISEHRFDKSLASLLVQGSKTTTIGTVEHKMQAGDILTVGIDLPSSSTIIEASPQEPLLTFFFELNRQTIGELLCELNGPAINFPHGRGVSVEKADADLMEAMLRLTYILNKPEQIKFRAPIALRDLHCLLLAGKQAISLREIYGQRGNQIFAAIAWLRSHLDTTVSAEALSRAAHISESTLYRQFKALTGLSPLQYHKQLRLHEARRLIICEGEQAAIAAYKTGYESVSQFSREYKKLFGQSPGRSKLHK